jgi:EthD domain
MSEATLLLARRPAGAGDAWLHRSLAALARRFRDARVRLFVADVPPTGLGPRIPPPASFDTLVVIERAKSAWPAPARPDATRDDALDWLSGARGYRAMVRKLRERPGAPRPAERSPGLVFAATAVRAPALEHAAFDAHWRDRHGPLALAHHVGMCGYEQLSIERVLTADAPAIDGVALLHFADPASYSERFYDSEAGRAAIAADTQRFLDLPRCEAALLGEHWARA